MKDLVKAVGDMATNIPENLFEFGITLLKKRRSMKITYEEFLRECTYFMLRCGFSELKHRVLPTRPQALLDYDEKVNEAKAFGRMYEAKDSFWRQKIIQSYIQQKYMVIQENASNLSWLKENFTRLEKYGDKHNAQIIRNRIQEFEEEL